jgi:hypothetical protein
MPWSKKTTLITAAAVVIVAVAVYEAAASGDAMPGLSVDQVHSAAAKLGDKGTVCPLKFDRAAAAKAGGLTSPLVPATDEPAAYAETPESSGPDGMAARAGMSMVGCQFTSTAAGAPVDVKVEVIAASKGSAMTAYAPVISMEAELTVSALAPFITTKLPDGQVRVAPSPGPGQAPAAAVGRFDAKGSGDVIVEVAISDDAMNDSTDTPKGVNLESLTKKLLDQIKL